MQDGKMHRRPLASDVARRQAVDASVVALKKGRMTCSGDVSRQPGWSAALEGVLKCSYPSWLPRIAHLGVLAEGFQTLGFEVAWANLTEYMDAVYEAPHLPAIIPMASCIPRSLLG
jgi:hypothetical protein